ncbi:VOC family protein [Glaciimonas sp. Gout2]|uniref:VOC family protein n=1 Tax=unclassified Glaciimonas TaxID=2644401 RepID=UPI002B224EF4|nr:MULTISPECIES: VOC family protein [unclassified Glaciimonas]MEB0011317.1 VOC family protein [Glaciimonas sp. Cout2]MEB0080967.1 VOC family protein [Glaciimonas sp. Gout2]
MKSFFHFAYHVHDLNIARHFYCNLLGCKEGRSADTWIDIDFFGHQLSLHLGKPFEVTNTGKVGQHMVPMPHFGVILQMDDWHKLADALSESAEVQFVIPPNIRFPGEAGEQATMFFVDPSGNPIEVKGFADCAQIYEK